MISLLLLSLNIIHWNQLLHISKTIVYRINGAFHSGLLLIKMAYNTVYGRSRKKKTFLKLWDYHLIWKKLYSRFGPWRNPRPDWKHTFFNISLHFAHWQKALWWELYSPVFSFCAYILYVWHTSQGRYILLNCMLVGITLLCMFQILTKFSFCARPC